VSLIAGVRGLAPSEAVFLNGCTGYRWRRDVDWASGVGL